MSGSPKPLASWKTWWTRDLAISVAKSLRDHIVSQNMLGKGRLLSTQSFTGDTLKDNHVASVAEALLVSYPGDHQPSAYLLGDAVLELDELWNGSLLGGENESPIVEKRRRDAALGEGQKLKKLLSYMRTSALKTENGKTPEVTYLKSLANQRKVQVKRSGSSAASTASESSSPGSFWSGTTLELGQLVLKQLRCFCKVYVSGETQ